MKLHQHIKRLVAALDDRVQAERRIAKENQRLARANDPWPRPHLGSRGRYRWAWLIDFDHPQRGRRGRGNRLLPDI